MRLYVEAPAVTPAAFGLLSVATVIPQTDGRFGMGTQYETDSCAPARLTAGACTPDLYLGVITITADDASTVTVTSNAGMPTPDAIAVEWGDGDDDTGYLPNDVPTHTYGADGDYTITFTSGLFTGSVEVTIEDGVVTGPWTVTTLVPKNDDDDARELVESFTFAVYKLTTCRLIGNALDEEKARRRLQLGEGRAVETVTAERLAVAAGAADSPYVTDATPVHPLLALAALEAYADATYGGVATLHLPRDVVTVLTAWGAIIRVGTQLQTVQGNLVASGYSNGGNGMPLPWDASTDSTFTYPAAGGAVGYVTGQVVLRRSATIETTPSSSNRRTNEGSVLAERVYDLAWECMTAAAVFDMTKVGGGSGGSGDVDGGTP